MLFFAVSSEAAPRLAEDLELRFENIELEGYEHPKRCHEGSSTLCVMRVETGEEVPFSGILQTVEIAARNAAAREMAEKRFELTLEKQKKNYELRIDHLKDEHEIDRDAWAEKEKAYKKALKKAGPKWYASPVFVAITTGVVVLGAVVLYENLTP